jgi:hypothetical protein
LKAAWVGAHWGIPGKTFAHVLTIDGQLSVLAPKKLAGSLPTAEPPG